MKELKDFFSGIPLLGLVTFGFLAGTLYGSEFSSEDWETLAAGFLGLLGGTFAFFAAKSQIDHQKEREEEKKISQVRRFLQELEFTLQTVDYTLQVIQDNNHKMRAEDGELLVDWLVTFNVSNTPPEVPDQFAEPAMKIRRDANILRAIINAKIAKGELDETFKKLEAGQVRLIEKMLKNITQLRKEIIDHLKP